MKQKESNIPNLNESITSNNNNYTSIDRNNISIAYKD